MFVRIVEKGLRLCFYHAGVLYSRDMFWRYYLKYALFDFLLFFWGLTVSIR